MRPTAKDVHVDQIMSNISVAYRNGMYIAESIFPIVKVLKQSDLYYKFAKGDWFRNEAQKRAPGGQSEGGGFSVSTDNYYAEEIAYHTLLDDEARDNSDSVLSLETAKVNFVTDKILLKLEKAVADFCTTSGNWAGTHSPADKWEDYDNSDPVTDLETGIDYIEDRTGQPVNTIAMGQQVWKKLKHHPQLLDRLPVTGLRSATVEHLKQLLEVEKILIGKALINTAKEGQTDVFSRVWGKTVFLGHVATAPARETPSAGYIFVWPRDGQIRGVRRWRDEDHHADKIEAFMSFDEKVVSSDCGYTITAAVS